VRGLRLLNLCDCWNDISGHANPVAGLVSRHLWLILSSLSMVLSGNPLQSIGDQPKLFSSSRKSYWSILDSNDVWWL
jgi:hypothetical protein